MKKNNHFIMLILVIFILSILRSSFGLEYKNSINKMENWGKAKKTINLFLKDSQEQIINNLKNNERELIQRSLCYVAFVSIFFIIYTFIKIKYKPKPICSFIFILRFLIKRFNGSKYKNTILLN